MEIKLNEIEFQSLIDKIKTSQELSVQWKIYEFQSLIGKIKTSMTLHVTERLSYFNPS